MVNFKQLLEKASNSELSEPDWETIMEIVEEVKTKNTSAKNAIKEFRKRLLDSNGNVVYHTLLVLDSLMKNCASEVHGEVLCVEFLGVIKTVITSKNGKSEKAVDKALELIGEWKTAFGEQSGYKAINTVFSELEREGYHIPISQVASAAFIKKAPEWLLRDKCFMCHQEFNRFKGKLRHHCRNCGQSVCAQCSSKRVPLPHFGVEEATRVCDICYKKVEKGEGESAATAGSSDLPVEYLRSSLAQESQVPSSSPSNSGGGAQQQMQEEDDLQLAIAMSLNEQENKQKKVSFAPAKRHHTPPQSATPSAPPPAPSTLYASIVHDTPSDLPHGSGSEVAYQEPAPPQQQPEQSADPLARYLDRNYWEQRKEQQASGGVGPSATVVPTQVAGGPPPPQTAEQAKGGSPLADSISNTIQMFVKRLHQVNSSGGSIAADPVVLSLYQNLTAMQPQLLKQIDDIQQQKAKQLEVVNRLNEAKEARVTLNKMRRDHQDKVKQMEQEQAMLARMQMEQKLALLRQQKQEQLAFQQTLQNKRLEVLNTQRAEYEQKVALQRELERQQLIAQEQKVLQHQFGGVVGGTSQYGGSPQPTRNMQTSMATSTAQSYMSDVPPQSLNLDPTTLPLQSMTLHDPTQALPLPPKVEYHTPGMTTDPLAPPPYNPNESMAMGQEPPQGLPSLYNSFQPSSGSFQPHGSSGLLPPISQGPSSLMSAGPGTQQQPPSSMGVTAAYASDPNLQSVNLQPANLHSMQPLQQPNGRLPPLQQNPGGYGGPTSLPAQPPLSAPSSQPNSYRQPSPRGYLDHIPPSQSVESTSSIVSGVGGGPSYQSYSPQQPPQQHQQQQQQQPAGGFLPNGPPPQQQFLPSGPSPQQQQQFPPNGPPGGYLPNGPPPQQQQQLGRQESEPPLISFD